MWVRASGRTTNERDSLDDQRPVSAEEIVRDARRRGAAGRVAGLLFLAGSLTLLPSTWLLSPRPAVWVYSLTLLGVISGVLCLRLPWGRLSPRWLEAVPVVATVEVALVVFALGGDGVLYAPLSVLMAVFAAYALRRRAAIAVQVGVLMVALLAAAIAEGAAGERLVPVVVAIPILCIAAAVVAHLREQLEAGQDAYRRLAGRDPLTGVGNYRALYDRLEYELARHHRHERPLTVILVDLDGFKAINDTHGHLAGDEALRRVGHALATIVRAEDTLARHGGDEFSILHPETDRPATSALIDRIKGVVAAIDLDGTHLSASIGTATYPQDGHTADELLTTADHALRTTKPPSPRTHASPTPPPPPLQAGRPGRTAASR
jgi:diguanylate cyclase (GGDEF)-like protein